MQAASLRDVRKDLASISIKAGPDLAHVVVVVVVAGAFKRDGRPVFLVDVELLAIWERQKTTLTLLPRAPGVVVVVILIVVCRGHPALTVGIELAAIFESQSAAIYESRSEGPLATAVLLVRVIAKSSHARPARHVAAGDPM